MITKPFALSCELVEQSKPECGSTVRLFDKLTAHNSPRTASFYCALAILHRLGGVNTFTVSIAKPIKIIIISISFISNSGCTIIWMKSRVSKQVAVDVDNFGWRKTIEMGRCCSAIGTDVSTVEDVVTLQIGGKFFCL